MRDPGMWTVWAGPLKVRDVCIISATPSLDVGEL